MRVRRRTSALIGAAAACALVTAAAVAPTASAKPSLVDLQILSFNDYHGNIEPPAGSNGTVTVGFKPATPPATGQVAVPSAPLGGAAYLASTLQSLRTGKRNTVTVAAGDLIGASPIVSGLFKDEPAIETLNAMGLDVSGVGNHEFDEGIDELLRMQYGGCSPVDGCYDADGYSGANFPWLAANVTWKPGVTTPKPNDTYGDWFSRRTGRTVLPPTWVKTFDGVRVGFIGMTLEGTPELVAQAGIKDLDFGDEVAAAGLAARDLRQRGVEAIVVLIHEGGLPPSGTTYDYVCNSPGGAAAISGPIVQIAQTLDPSIVAFISGPTHQTYTCMIPDPAGVPRAVTSASSFGRLVTETNLKLNRITKDVVRSSVSSVNHLVLRTTADPVQESIVKKWQELAAPIANEAVATITQDIKRGATRAVESSLPNLIADAQLDRTKVNGAQIALMNPGGVRADLVYAKSGAEATDGIVTYGEMFAVQPFGNTLLTMTLTGAQVKTALEQQWSVRSGTLSLLYLGISKGLTYSYDTSRPVGDRVLASTLKLNGVVLDPNASYRVTVNSFLADGGDSFTVFKAGTNRVGGGVDLDEFVAYMAANQPVSAPPADRGTKVG